MHAKTTAVAAILALAGSASATVFPTAPVASTSWQAGVPQTVSWRESITPTPPTLEEFGNAKISIHVGNQRQQTLVQLISESFNVANASSIEFTPNPEIGPDSDEYFIRFESLETRDPEAPQFPALAFSAKFRLTGMTGEFNATVQAQIDGQSSAPLGGATTTTGPNTATGTSTRTNSAPSGFTTTNSARPNGTSTSAGANSTQTDTNAATAVGVKGSIAWVGALVGAVIGAALF